MICLLIIVPTLHAAEPYVIDDFESQNLDNWWFFGSLTPSIAENNIAEYPFLHRYSMQFKAKGSTQGVGGAGKSLSLDLTGYQTIKALIKGSGEKSGTLIFELYETDSDGVFQVNEKSPAYLDAGSRFIYTQKIDWFGWKVIMIPLKWFRKDTNVLRNTIETPGKNKLVQLQLIAVGANQQHSVDFQIDRLKFY